MDWDQDGVLDVVSGSYVIPGELAGDLHFLRGNGDTEFEAATTILNSKGTPIRNVEADSSNVQRCLINYCTHPHAIDFDDDGDLDLLVGSNMDGFFLHENKAESGEGNSISPNAVQLSIRLPEGGRHSAPHLVDWDLDGDLDLLTGTSVGGVLLSRNSGSSQKPVWEAFESLVPFSKSEDTEEEVRIDEVQPGNSTRVWVCDYNKDGLPDLVVGDCSEVVELKTDASEKEFQEALSVYNEMVENKEAGAELAQAKDKCEQFLKRRKTGFVWVYLQDSKQIADNL